MTDGDSGIPSRRKWMRRLLELSLVLGLLVAVRAWQQWGVATGPAPALEGVLLDGRVVSLTEFRGRPVLVHFWATWCPVCALEEKSIDAIAGDHPVITVAMQSGSDAEVSRYLAEKGLDFPVLNDPRGALAARWGVRAVPASFIIDPAGWIRFTEVGFTTAIGLRVRLWLAG